VADGFGLPSCLAIAGQLWQKVQRFSSVRPVKGSVRESTMAKALLAAIGISFALLVAAFVYAVFAL